VRISLATIALLSAALAGCSCSDRADDRGGDAAVDAGSLDDGSGDTDAASSDMDDASATMGDGGPIDCGPGSDCADGGPADDPCEACDDSAQCTVDSGGASCLCEINFYTDVQGDGSECREEYGWAATLDATGRDAAHHVARGADGRLYVAGRFRGELSTPVGDFVAEDTGDSFLAGYSDDGELLWLHHFPGGLLDAVGGIALDAAGDLWVAGEFFYATTIAGSELNAPGAAGFVARFDPDGGLQQLWPALESMLINDLVVVDGGDLQLTGEFSGDIDLGGPDTQPELSAVERSPFTARFGPLGELRWARSVAVTSGIAGAQLALAPDGSSWLAFHFDDQYQGVDGGMRAAVAGDWEGAVVKLDAAGVPVFDVHFAAEHTNTIHVVSDRDGDAWVGLTYEAPVVVRGPGANTDPHPCIHGDGTCYQAADFLVARLDAETGEPKFVRTFGAADGDYVSGRLWQQGPTGPVWMQASASAPIDFGAQDPSGNPTGGFQMARLGDDGVATLIRRYDGNGVVLDGIGLADDRMWLVGSYPLSLRFSPREWLGRPLGEGAAYLTHLRF